MDAPSRTHLPATTKQEFIARQTAMAQSSNKRTVPWLLVFFGVLISGVPLSIYAEHHEELTWLGPAMGVGLIAFLFGNILFLSWSAKRQQRRFGVFCPNCGKPLVAVGAQITIATGNCGFCGERVFSETLAS